MTEQETLRPVLLPPVCGKEPLGYPERPGGRRYICALPKGHEGDHQTGDEWHWMGDDPEANGQ